MKIAFIGAGRLAQALAPAFHQAGFDVVAIAARSQQRAAPLAQSIAGCQLCASAQQAADLADLVFVAVNDAAIEDVARAIRWRTGQMVVHCSGATEVAVLGTAAQQGAWIGGFHPLQLFADPDVALRCMAGSSVAIEAEAALETALQQLAQAVGYRAIKLPAGARGRYHCATNYGASFLLSLLREACDLWNSFGVGDEQALAALLPLARGTLETAAAKGLAGAIAGPISRGDADVVALHMRELTAVNPDNLDLYREVSLRLLRLAREQARLDDATLARLEATILAQR
ncbi:MAG: DUF2520 domain-containing protein [Comamonas sp.]|uniref:Rossmann-like and DUF2520 domain-containing protein n=1 Tax=Comamonas sp. TaxID=34028 RepID=UPI002FCB46D5